MFSFDTTQRANNIKNRVRHAGEQTGRRSDKPRIYKKLRGVTRTDIFRNKESKLKMLNTIRMEAVYLRFSIRLESTLHRDLTSYSSSWSFILVFRWCSLWISTGSPGVPIEMYGGFLQSLQENIVLLSQLGHDHFFQTLSNSISVIQALDTMYSRTLFLIWLFKETGSRGSSDGIATGYGLDDWGSIPCKSKRFFCASQRPDRIWCPYSRVSNEHRGLSPRLNRPKREADHSPPYRAEEKNLRSRIHLHTLVLNEAQEQVYLSLLFEETAYCRWYDDWWSCRCWGNDNL
jgi:hypothetical protein